MGAKCIQPARKAAVVAAFAAVCLLCQPVRAADPAAAEVLSAGGRVSVIRDSIEWALFAGSNVQVGELIVTGEDGFAHLQVADGSSFTVYPDSQVVFRKNPGNLKDLLDLFLGRIKVHIQKLGGGPNQQRVFTPTAVISVRGTVFDVSVDEDETTVVAVDEGLVGVSHRLLPANIEVEVPEGQSLIIYRNAPWPKRASTSPGRLPSLMSWPALSPTFGTASAGAPAAHPAAPREEACRETYPPAARLCLGTPRLPPPPPAPDN